MDLDEIAAFQAIQNLEQVEINGARPRRTFLPKTNPFEKLTDEAFIKMFRFNKNMAIQLINSVSNFIEPSSRSSAIDVDLKVLIALRFYAAGSYQFDTASNVYCAVSQASASRAINEVTNALNRPEIFNRWVKYPSTVEELRAIRNKFYQKHGFPGVVGCVDCTHVAIVPPLKEDPLYPEYIYVNRKHYHSINTQLICDSDLRILNVNARYPGSTHDSFIWNNSRVKTVMENIYRGDLRGFYLLGDSGYALRPWLLTPLENEPDHDTPEGRFNIAHKSSRAVIERCNGVLKMRFRCLLKHRVLHYTPEVASKIINACVVLHNICIHNNLPDPEPQEGDEYIDFGMYENLYNLNMEDIPNPAIRARINVDLEEGMALRRRLIANYFN
ncbi:putative nuclease HARBI1 [Anoplophora glabripennis]|uniref:putative nuclease HARBI1 n=1 Tax=Anoplophora glabripennis TaxID=217634 RepID=UPI000874C33F|nr:putative nuclease HARBI1 [Anoplophora glabripennis]